MGKSAVRTVLLLLLSLAAAGCANATRDSDVNIPDRGVGGGLDRDVDAAGAAPVDVAQGDDWATDVPPGTESEVDDLDTNSGDDETSSANPDGGDTAQPNDVGESRDVGVGDEGDEVGDADTADVDVAPEPVRCDALNEGVNALCAATADRCEGVFHDRSGCAAYCARVGLVCLASFEDVDGACAPDLARDELACRDTGHHSDYCVCGRAGCTPSCAGRECGSDGCGGECGPCADGGACLEGVCQGDDRPWERLLEGRVGYGRNATGGAGGSVCWVENLNDSGSGSFRSCAQSDESRWIRFRVSGDIRLNSPVAIGSNTTVDGRGQRIRFSNRGLNISGKRNIILHNFEMRGDASGSDDAIKLIDGARDIWIDHLTLEDYFDGLIDITRASTGVTVSWCRFLNHDKVMLISASADHSGDTVIRVTLHHNWFEQTHQRHPRLRYGRVHAFNNYYDRWGSYAIGSSQRGQVRSEANVYQAGSRRDAFTTSFDADPQQGDIRSDGDLRLGSANLTERNRGSVFNPADDYAYVAESATTALRDRITAGAGWRDVPAP